jgi:hypothetical protein
VRVEGAVVGGFSGSGLDRDGAGVDATEIGDRADQEDQDRRTSANSTTDWPVRRRRARPGEHEGLGAAAASAISRYPTARRRTADLSHADLAWDLSAIEEPPKVLSVPSTSDPARSELA